MSKTVFRNVTWLLLAVFIAPTTFAADKKKDPLDGLKCFIMKKRKVKKKKVITFKGAQLYLCCGTCVRRMKKTPQKYMAKANHQIVLTGQFIQKACPVSGGKLDGKTTLKVAGVEVKFASKSHRDKVAKLSVDKQIKALFGNDGFKKGKFTLKKKSKKKKKA